MHTITKGDRSLKNVLIAACGAVLQGRADLHKALYLFGTGRNGKGAFLTLLELLVGEENSQPSSLESICENRFEMANFYNKRLIVCADEEKRVRGFSNFKKLTGGDVLRGEDKGVKAFGFRYQGMVVLASNDPVFVGDASYGLSERLIPIPFTQKIPKSERRNLVAEFTADLPAFTTYLLNLDRDWVSDTLKQANDLKAINDLAWELTIQTDSIAAFYEEQLIYDPKPTTYDGEKVVYERDWVLAANAYKAYRQFCSDTGFVAKHQNNFCRSLVNLLADKLEKDVSSRKTKVGKVIEGLRLRNILDRDGDEVTTVTTNLENNQIFKLVDRGDEVTTVTTNLENNQIFKLVDRDGDEVTTVTTNLDFSTSADPKPPTSDRAIPEITKVDEYVTYLLIGDRVEWLEIAFHKYGIAKEWESQIVLWGGQTEKPHQISRNGKKWLLRVKGLTKARLDRLLTCNLGQTPQQPSRK